MENQANNGSGSTFLVDITKTEVTTYFKAGIYGEQGSGKTHTAVNAAIGIAKQIGADAIAFYDTERSAAFHRDRVKKAGLKFYVTTGKSLKGAIQFVYECERLGIGCAITDSVTHLYREMVAAYCKEKGIRSPVMRDWGFLKPMWYEFSDAFVQTKLHLIACGRAGVVTEDTHDESGRVDGFNVVGTKMKGEAEFGYEANLEIELEQIPLTKKLRVDLKKILPKEKQQFLDRANANKAIIKKDRNPNPKESMMGREIWFPCYRDFSDHIAALNIGGTFLERAPGDSSQELFTSERGMNMNEYIRRKEIVLGSLWEEVIVLAELDGTAKETKQARVRALVEVFGTAAKAEIENMRIEEIMKGTDLLRRKYKLPPYNVEAPEPAVAADPVLDAVAE